MNPLEQLNGYLERLEARLRLKALSRGAALAALAALGATVALVLIANGFAFSGASVASARVVLFLAVALALAFALVIPVLRLNRFGAARTAEQRLPELEQRLLTLAERPSDAGDPFLQLLAADTLRACEQAPPEHVVPRGRLAALLSAAAAAAGVLVWLIVAGPGYLGYGAALLWAGPAKRGAQPFYDVIVSPGNRTVRRKSDQMIEAKLAGFQTPQVRLLARYRGASKWEEIAMRPQPEGSGYEFLFAAVAETLDYYVQAGLVRSPTYTLNVKDLPAVKNLRVTYHFPQWTGLPDQVEDPGGDLRAVEGTEAEVAVETDRALSRGVLVLDSGERVPLRDGAARLAIQKDGSYYVAALEDNEPVRLSEDYFIAAQKASPPAVRIERPARDARVSPIEEVTIAAQAEDEFGLQELALHYSVNGGPEKTVSLLTKKGAKNATASATIALEDFKLAPGDLVSLYATARNALQPAKTDIHFLQAEPFERSYSQSQQMGGEGGAMGGQQDENRLSERQKDIIAATWNELREKSAGAAENGRFLSGVQSKLRDQARSLASRMNSRALSGTNETFQQFARNMEQAAADMETASGKLRSSQWQSALAPEQQALQHILRAEALFRDIQVAFGNRGGRGGGGGGGGGMGRDLENLFDLELDTEKNQYETGRQSAASERDRALDDAFQKLEQLARRQQELASRQEPRQSFQQRWQQEMLRREAEELQRRVEQLARGNASGDQRTQQALDQLRRAADDMRRGGSQGGSAEARRAAERLNDARRLLEGAARQESATQMDSMARRSEQLAGAQRDFSDRLRQAYGGESAKTDARADEALATEQDRLRSELERLESEMRDAVRNLAGTQRAASSKLREALGNVEQQEARVRMQYNAGLIRRGLGAYTAMRQAPVTRALEDLREQVRDAQAALGRDPSQGREGQAERALAQVERLRGQMERGGEDRGAGGQRNADWFGGSGWARGMMRLRQALQDFPELARRIEHVEPGAAREQLEQIELELRRRIDGDSPGQVRSAPGEPVPPGYADAVAEYFRRLSKTP